MVLRKITFDNSLKYIPKSEQTKEKSIKQNTIKSNSPPKKQTKNHSQNKKLLKNLSAQGFKYLK